MLQDAKTRAILIQIAGVSVVVLTVLFAVFTAWQRMNQQGLAYGFGILFTPTGWSLQSPFLRQDATDPYWWTLAVALMNTAVAGVASILASSVIGLFLGVALTAGNKVVASLCMLYVEIFRNVPLVLQAVFWYVTFTRLPNPRSDPPSFFNLAFFSNKGFVVPWLDLGPQGGFLVAAVVLLALALLLVPPARRPKWLPTRATSLGLLVPAVFCAVILASPSLSVPALKGFNFQGGMTIPLEFLALVFAIVIFNSAYVGEIVRGGLKSVPRGQIEAAQSLGLPPLLTFLMIRFPIALRSMIPPLGNQFIFVMKATALGIAVGYSDIFAASMVSISQTGQSIEFLAVMMAAYFILNYSMTLLVHWLNRRVAFKGARR